MPYALPSTMTGAVRGAPSYGLYTYGQSSYGRSPPIHGLYRDGLYRYGLYSYVLCSYGPCSHGRSLPLPSTQYRTSPIYGLYSYGLYSYVLCSCGPNRYGLHSYGLHSRGAQYCTSPSSPLPTQAPPSTSTDGSDADAPVGSVAHGGVCTTAAAWRMRRVGLLEAGVSAGTCTARPRTSMTATWRYGGVHVGRQPPMTATRPDPQALAVHTS